MAKFIRPENPFRETLEKHALDLLTNAPLIIVSILGIAMMILFLRIVFAHMKYSRWRL